MIQPAAGRHVDHVVSDRCRCWPAAGGGHEGTWRCAWSSSDIRQTRHSGGTSLQLPRLGHPAYLSPAVRWTRLYSDLQADTVSAGLLQRCVVRCSNQHSAVFRSCSVSRTLRRGSSHSRQGHILYLPLLEQLHSFLFVHESSTSWPCWHSRSVVRQPQRTWSSVTFHVVFVPPTRLYCTNLLPELTLPTVLSLVLLLQCTVLNSLSNDVVSSGLLHLLYFSLPLRHYSVRRFGLVDSHDRNLSVSTSGVFDILALYKLELLVLLVFCI